MTLLSQGISRIALTMVVGRLAGPSVLGIVASMLSLAQLMVLAWPASNGTAAARFLPRERGSGRLETRPAIVQHLARRAVESGVILGLVAAGIWTIGYNAGPSSGLIVLLMVLGYAGVALVNGVLQATGQFVQVAWWSAAIGVAALSAVLIMLLAGYAHGPWLVLPLALSSLLQSVLRWPYAGRGTPIRRPLKREIDRFVATATIGTLASAGFYQASILVAAAALGAQSAGQYAAVVVLAMPLLLLVTSLTAVAYPAIAEAVGRDDKALLRQQVDDGTRVIALIMVTVTGALSLCAPLVIDLIWGPDFRTAAPVLPLVLAGVLVTALVAPSNNFMVNTSQRNAATATGLSVFSAVVGMGFWWAFVTSGGLIAVAGGYLVGKAVFMVAVVGWTVRHLHLAWSGVIVRTGCAVVAVAVWTVLLQVGLVSGSLALPSAFTFVVGWLLLAKRDTARVIELVRSNMRGGR